MRLRRTGHDRLNHVAQARTLECITRLYTVTWVVVALRCALFAARDDVEVPNPDSLPTALVDEERLETNASNTFSALPIIPLRSGKGN